MVQRTRRGITDPEIEVQLLVGALEHTHIGQGSGVQRFGTKAMGSEWMTSVCSFG
jgi:hypothetical protein